MHRFTVKEIRFLERKIPGRSLADMTALFNARFGLELTEGQIGNALSRHGLRSGRDCRFRPGQVSHNKGKTGCYPGCEKGHFKKGNRPWNWKPVGSERVNADGYTEVKVRNPKKWKCRHILVWEAANGKVPKGRVIIFADGNRSNPKLENLLMVSRSELAVMNHLGLISGCAEGTKAGKLIADIRMKAAELKRGTGKRKTGKGAKVKRCGTAS
jgi:hypothetical protein